MEEIAMAKGEQTVHIDAPVERVFEFLTHPENLPPIWPSMVSVENVVTHPDGSSSFDWVYKMAGKRFSGHTDPVAVRENELMVTRSESGIPSEWRWSFSRENGGTRLDVSVEYEIPSRVLRALAEPLVVQLNRRDLSTVLENLKSVMEAGLQRAAE